MPVLRSWKAGGADSGPAKGEGVQAGVGSRGDRGEGGDGEGVIGGNADVFGRPAGFAPSGDVGVNAFVGGVAGAGDRPVIDGVEEPGGFSASG